MDLYTAVSTELQTPIAPNLVNLHGGPLNAWHEERVNLLPPGAGYITGP